jgi:hypothetical protein
MTPAGRRGFGPAKICTVQAGFQPREHEKMDGFTPMKLQDLFIFLLPILAACGHVERVGDGETDGDGPCPDGQTPCEGGCVDTDADRENCGVCGHFCQNGDHGTGVCIGGACDLDCDDGWWDIDNDVGTGCEYRCDLTEDGNERCNGIDDNCDGRIDNMTADTCPRGQVFACTTECGTEGTAVCDDDCNPGDCVPPDEECNGEDDDCDGADDNGFDCIQDAAVACTTTCGTAGTGTCTHDCRIPPPGACQVPDETCNGIDDDCDDEIDEDVFGITVEPVDVTTNSHRAQHPVIAFGETGFLLAWQDDRDGNLAELYATAVSPAGDFLVNGERLIGNPDEEYLGDIAWDGSYFGLAYASDNLTGGDLDLWMALANEDADRVDSDRVAARTQDQTHPRIVWDETQWAMVWCDDRGVASQYNAYFAQVDPSSLNIIPTSETPLTLSMTYPPSPDIAWSGSAYGIVWNERDTAEELLFVGLDADGTVTVAPRPITTDYQRSFKPSIAWASSEWVVAWAGWVTESNKGYWMATLDAEGNKLAADLQVDFMTELYEGEAPPISIVHIPGLGIGAVWQKVVLLSRIDIYFQRFDYDLVPLGEPLHLTSAGLNHSPVLDWDGSGFGIAWSLGNPASGTEYPILRFARVGCL